MAPHLFNWHNSWKGPDDLDNFHLAKCFDAEALFEICALPDEPALTRFKVVNGIVLCLLRGDFESF